MKVSGATKGRLMWTVRLGAVLAVCLILALSTLAGSSDDVGSQAGSDPAEQGLSIKVTCTKSDLPEDLRSNTDVVFEIQSCPNSDVLCTSEGIVIATLSPFVNKIILEKSPYQKGWLEGGTFPDNITLHLVSRHDIISDCLRCHRTVDMTFSPRLMNVSTVCFKDLTALAGRVSSGPLSVHGPTASTSAQIKKLLSAVEDLPAVLLANLNELLTCDGSQYSLPSFVLLVLNLLVHVAMCAVFLFILRPVMSLVLKYQPSMEDHPEDVRDGYEDVELHTGNLNIRTPYSPTA